MEEMAWGQSHNPANTPAYAADLKSPLVTQGSVHLPVLSLGVRNQDTARSLFLEDAGR